jgi:flagellum-specific peptidoglycan hydrolase FlgJ
MRMWTTLGHNLMSWGVIVNNAEFIMHAVRHARVAKENGAPINVPIAVAQAALESAYGSSGLARRDNNLFGIKGEYKGLYGLWNTREQNADKSWVTVEAKFKRYPSWTECFEDYGSLIARLPWYAAAARNHEHAEKFLRGIVAERDASGKVIKPGWATDFNYYDKVMKVVSAHNLMQYERGDDLELIQVFRDNEVLEFRPTKVTWGTTNSGRKKLMIKE